MALSRSEIYAEMWEANMNATLTAAEGVPEAKRLKVAQEGKAHPLWLIGHLANTNNLLVNRWCCDADSLLPKEYGKMFAPDFAGGVPIVTDASSYPGWDEVLADYRKVAEACAKGIRGLSDAELDGGLRGGAPEDMNTMFGPADKTIRSMLMHEAHHRGQLALIVGLG